MLFSAGVFGVSLQACVTKELASDGGKEDVDEFSFHVTLNPCSL